MPNGTELPVQDGDDARLRRMQYYVVEFEVAVDDGGAIRGHIFAYVVYDFVEVGVGAAEGLAGGNVLDLSLLGFDAGEGVAVAGVEGGFLAEVLEADGVWVDGVHPGEGGDHGEPGGAALDGG